jgi:hypothetical protein
MIEDEWYARDARVPAALSPITYHASRSLQLDFGILGYELVMGF